MEFYTLIIDKIKEDKKLWYKNNNGSLYPTLLSDKENNDEILKSFKLLGYIIGRGIYDDRLLDIPLNSTFWNLILHTIIFKDLSMIDIDLYKTILDFNNLRIDESGYRIQCDHYRLFTYEIFLYTIAILLRNEAYSEVRYLLGTIYFYTYRGDNREGEVSVFCENEIESIDESRNTRLGLNKICLSASLIIGRSKFANDDFKNDLITS